VAWADQALLDGFDTPSLIRLSGLARTDRSEVRHDEIAPEFIRSLGEFGVPIPPRDIAIRWHMEELAQQIYDGRITPRTGLDRIHSEGIVPLHHPEDLRPWCNAWSGLDPSGDPAQETTYTNAMIFALVASFLSPNTDKALASAPYD
jgi:hypothetical protein